MKNNWTALGAPDTSEGGFKVTLRASGNNAKDVAEDITYMMKFASDYQRIEFTGDNPVVEIDFSTLAHFEKFSKELA